MGSGFWFRVRRRLLAGIMVAGLVASLLGAPAPAAATISPTFLEVTLLPGESVTEVKTVEVPRIIPKADIMFSFDLTGSMGGVLNTAKSQAINIMNDLDTLISDAHYGVMSYMDYPGCFNSYGYSACYGSAGVDYPYRLDMSPTGDRMAVSGAINSLVLGYGNDGPESYTRPLYESYSDPALMWRDGARRIVINFGDNIPHDNNLDEGTGASGTWSTGGDPGRDGIMFTEDDLDHQEVIAGMAANGVILFAVQSFGSYIEPYWRTWSEATGGQAVALGSAGGLAAAIRDVIERSASLVHDLRLVASPGFESWVSFSPAAYTELVTPATVHFDVTITVPPGTPSGDYHFTIEAIGDGASYGVQDVLVHVDGNPPLTTLHLSGTPGNFGWWRSDVTATLTAVDDFSGVKETRYDLDGGGMTVYGGAFLIFGDGSHGVDYHSEDNAGNVEPVHHGDLRIDATPPDVSGMLDGTLGDHGWYVSPVTFTMTAGDAMSGLADSFFDVFYTLGGPDGDELYTGPVVTPDEGMYGVQFHATDVAGNDSGLHALDFKIDLMPPEISHTPLDADYATSEAVYIEYGATDTMSGVASVEAMLNGSPVASGSDLILAPGEYELVISARDMAGHESEVRAHFRVWLDVGNIRFEPEVLEKNNTPRWVTVFVQFPAGIDLSTIRCETVLLNGAVPAICDGGYDRGGDGRHRIFKFSGAAVSAIAPDAAAEWTVTLTGEYGSDGGLWFTGSDIIRVQDASEGSMP